MHTNSQALLWQAATRPGMPGSTSHAEYTRTAPLGTPGKASHDCVHASNPQVPSCMILMHPWFCATSAHGAAGGLLSGVSPSAAVEAPQGEGGTLAALPGTA